VAYEPILTSHIDEPGSSTLDFYLTLTTALWTSRSGGLRWRLGVVWIAVVLAALQIELDELYLVCRDRTWLIEAP